MGFFSIGLKNEFETAVVNEPSVFRATEGLLYRSGSMADTQKKLFSPHVSMDLELIHDLNLKWLHNRSYPKLESDVE